jgi:hypothetical protein
MVQAIDIPASMSPLLCAPVDQLRGSTAGRWSRVCDAQFVPFDHERSREFDSSIRPEWSNEGYARRQG